MSGSSDQSAATQPGDPGEPHDPCHQMANPALEASQPPDLPASKHHLLKHRLPVGSTLSDAFGAISPREVAREINRMGQKELQAKFRDLYQTQTFSNNNQWLRRKLMEAVGLAQPKPGKKGRSLAYRPGSAGEGVSSGKRSKAVATDQLEPVRRTARVRKPTLIYTDVPTPRTPSKRKPGVQTEQDAKRLTSTSPHAYYFGQALQGAWGRDVECSSSLDTSLTRYPHYSPQHAGALSCHDAAPSPRSPGGVHVSELVWVHTEGSVVAGRLVTRDEIARNGLVSPAPGCVYVHCCDGTHGWFHTSEVQPYQPQSSSFECIPSETLGNGSPSAAYADTQMEPQGRGQLNGVHQPYWHPTARPRTIPQAMTGRGLGLRFGGSPSADERLLSASGYLASSCSSTALSDFGMTATDGANVGMRIAATSGHGRSRTLDLQRHSMPAGAGFHAQPEAFIGSGYKYGFAGGAMMRSDAFLPPDGNGIFRCGSDSRLLPLNPVRSHLLKKDETANHVRSPALLRRSASSPANALNEGVLAQNLGHSPSLSLDVMESSLADHMLGDSPSMSEVPMHEAEMIDDEIEPALYTPTRRADGACARLDELSIRGTDMAQNIAQQVAHHLHYVPDCMGGGESQHMHLAATTCLVPANGNSPMLPRIAASPGSATLPIAGTPMGPDGNSHFDQLLTPRF